SAEQVADCYRLRWQIELAFKRLKSLLHLDALRAKNARHRLNEAPRRRILQMVQPLS
nr:transposase [Escherichia coli]